MSELSQDAAANPPRGALGDDLPVVRAVGGLAALLPGAAEQEAATRRLEALLPAYLKEQRWFGAKDRQIRRVEIRDAVCLPAEPGPACLSMLRVDLDGRSEYYTLPLAVAYGAAAERLRRKRPRAALAWLEDAAGRGLLHDASATPAFWLALLGWWQAGRPHRSPRGRYVPRLDDDARAARPARVRVFSGEQSNSSALFDDRYYVKLYRRLEEGVNPETELLEHLTAVGFAYAPRLYGTLALERAEASFALAILQQAVPVETDGWAYARAMTARFLDRVAEAAPPTQPAPPEAEAAPPWLDEAAPEMLALARTLGVRTAEMHLALARADAPALRPEPGTPADVRAFVARIREEARQTRRMLEAHAGGPSPADDAWQRALRRLDALARTDAACPRIRVHGDYHLGQVVRSEGQFYLLDFEGEPARSLEERRARDCNLRDVAGMLRSLEYAALSAWQERRAPSGGAVQEAWIHSLVGWCQALFLDAYYAAAGEAVFLPPEAGRRLFVWAYLLHKALYEVRYELSHRPDWTWLPLRGLRRLLDEA